MKKKFLSLMMAAAVVATTSVSAFAEVRDNVTYPDSENVTTQDDTDATSNVTITGNVADDKGNMPTASFKVTVPTAASFTVNKGGFIGAELEVKNEGPQEIEVYAQRFTRATGGSGEIQTVTEQAIKADTGNKLSRANVSLKLEGQRIGDQDSVAYLSVANGGNGVYRQNTLAESDVAGADGVKLLVLGAGNVTEKKGNIILSGSAAKGAVNKAIADKFQLTLKIKKVTKSAEGAGETQDDQHRG